MSLDLQSPAFRAKREAMQARAAASRSAFEEARFNAIADRALAAETAEVMSPDAFVARLAGMDDPFDTARGSGHGEETDHQG